MLQQGKKPFVLKFGNMLFLADIYSKKQIIADGVVPEDFVFSSSGYLAQVEGIKPPHGIYSHISGIDLVQAKDDSWFILEDNLRIPSGASYPLIARGLERKCSPQTFINNHVLDNRNYGTLLRDVMDDMNCGGINVVFTPGRYNAAYFEHAYLAEQTGSVLCQPEDLFVENNVVYCKTLNGKEKVGAIYRFFRIFPQSPRYHGHILYLLRKYLKLRNNNCLNLMQGMTVS